MHHYNVFGLIAAASISLVSADMIYGGVNIAGFEFDCKTNGFCDRSKLQPPTKAIGPGVGQDDGPGQMKHFADDDGFNLFRLPISWQYLVNGNLGGPLDEDIFSQYDGLVQACLNTGATCIIDVHNYARWDGGIIGQGGPSNEQFANLWSQLAGRYANSPKVAMGIMNEPWEVDIAQWGATVQTIVTTIREAGANSQMILLPGTDFQSARSFVSSGSADVLNGIKNPDGSTTNLIFDVHQYFDSDFSGTSDVCGEKGNQIVDNWEPLANWARPLQRQILWTESSGGNNDGCISDICAVLDFMNANSDVYLGFTLWAAGSFQADIPLTATPSGSVETGWHDTLLVDQCYRPKFHRSG